MVVTLLFDEWTQLGATRWAVNEALEARTAVTHRIGE
jgi:hypothetical protein